MSVTVSDVPALAATILNNSTMITATDELKTLYTELDVFNKNITSTQNSIDELSAKLIVLNADKTLLEADIVTASVNLTNILIGIIQTAT